ncbi:nickel/cobalt transporter [Dickeya solani]|uniref:Nickel/cobalt efflux system n=1 Tax=Dickeya solani D s0432-1 TaxID=1231725 RepID=A0AAV3K734_9GAMM|nr:nickel/cobalt transporter [Dickeya solani]ANE74428.1 nickel transporter [Dickeya solani IPO 2222]AUC41674.1 putative membrane protein [Dickeya solani RNS 08.23.3.1.A]AUH10156.1 nickel transporter [Dickeya solani D s0432-1]AUH14104.1 nickel transporter [Dickeya solani]AYQ48903.1 nickel/cobalt efflux protein RcnA [Dickeya solani]
MPVNRSHVTLNSLRWWPLALFLLLMVVVAWQAMVWWPSILMQSIEWQRSLHQQMSDLMEQVRAQPHQAGWTLVMFSLVYGVLHAVGPGHGKVVIATYLATHPSRLKSSLQLTFASALLQGTVAIALVTLVLAVLQLSSRALHIGSFWMEKSSFVLVAGLGGWLCLRAFRRLRALLFPRAKPCIRSLTPLDASVSGIRLAPAVHHQHDEHCGCGHQHVPAAEALNHSDGWRTRLMVVLAMGLRPCSGAIMVLLFAKVLDVFVWGVISALTMALGTALTVSLLGVAVLFCRRQLERLSRAGASSSPRWQPLVWSALSLAGGMALTFAGIVLYLTTQPDVMGGIRPLMG